MSAARFWDNPEKARETVAELKRTTGLLKPFGELNSTGDDLRALAELTEEYESQESEVELRREVAKAEKRLGEFELHAMLSGPNDSRSAFLRVQAGTGGTEACDWANMLLRMYLRWMEAHGYQAEVVDLSPAEEAGIRSATVACRGDYACGYLRSEVGVHRLVRISPFDANKRRHTSFAAVDVIPEIDEDIQIEIRPDDLKTDTFRSGGPGGQHQNKTESGVRITHLPTGVVVECRSERSQHKNRATAMKMLKAKLYRLEEQKREAELAKTYDEKGEIAWGNQIRSYVLDDSRVKDHRTGHETGNTQKVLDGDLDGFIQAYLRQQLGEPAKAGKNGK